MTRLPAPLTRTIRSVARRLALAGAADLAWRRAAPLTVAAAGGVWLLWGRSPVSVSWLWFPVALWALCAAWAWRRRRLPLAAAALVMDRRAGNDLALTTAVRAAPDHPFAPWLLADAEARLRSVRWNELFAWRPPLSLALFGIACAVYAGAVLNAPPAAVDARSATAERVRQKAARLAAVTGQAAGANADLMRAAGAAGEKLANGVTASSITDVTRLKERFEAALRDEAGRRDMLRRLSQFRSADAVEQALAAGDGEQIRLALDAFAGDVAAADADALRRELQAGATEHPEIKTLLLALDAGDKAEFVAELKRLLGGLDSAADALRLRQAAAAMTALQRELLASPGGAIAGGDAMPAGDGVGERGAAVGTANQNTMPEPAAPARAQAWTRGQWDRTAQTRVSRMPIDMTAEEDEIVRRYFSR